MTVKELIEKLKDLPQEMDVWIEYDKEVICSPIEDVNVAFPTYNALSGPKPRKGVVLS